MACSNCGNPKVFARGLCGGCYHRLRRRGTLARKNVVNSGKCKEEGCDRQAFSKNLCGRHYQLAQHALYSTWQTLRSRAQGAYPKAWDRFDDFLREVGERPTPRHQLRRPDPEKPWSKKNMVWREPIGQSFKGDSKAYQWAWHLRNRYGLTVEQVEAMHKAQDWKCAICEGQLASGKKVCIDHCHVTRKVRGILCDDCNKAIGLMNDDPARLRAAADYLDSHSPLLTTAAA